MVPPPVEWCGVAPPLAQKASEEFRAAWSEYCQYVAGNSRDPAPGYRRAYNKTTTQGQE